MLCLQNVMTDPVVASDGITYEQEDIQLMYEQEKHFSTLFHTTDLTPNLLVLCFIRLFGGVTPSSSCQVASSVEHTCTCGLCCWFNALLRRQQVVLDRQTIHSSMRFLNLTLHRRKSDKVAKGIYSNSLTMLALQLAHGCYRMLHMLRPSIQAEHST